MWTLNGKRISEYGFSNFRKKTMNQGIDRVEFQEGCIDIFSKGLLEFGEEVTIGRNSKRWFFGIVTKIPSYGTYGKEVRGYELSGPWWFLEHLVYQQSWEHMDSTEEAIVVEKSRCILGQNAAGEAITANAAIREILEYAIAQGAKFSVGNCCGFDFYFPFEEVRDISCAEAIQRILRWAPDSVVWFDYECDSFPKINIYSGENLPQKSLDINELESFDVVPRHDLVVNSVVLKYEYLHSEGSRHWRTIIVDKFPKNATGREFKSLAFTIELDGINAHIQRQRVSVVPVDPHTFEWWCNHIPTLENAALSNVTIENVSRETDLPYELIEGGIAPWMNCDVFNETIRATISYETNNEIVKSQPISVKIRTTNAQSKVYEKIIHKQLASKPPIGLAESFYKSVSKLPYDGKLTMKINEINHTQLGYALNILNGNKAWKKMNAVIQSVRENIDTGTIEITFGPPKHLGPDDLIQLMRSNRNRVAPVNAHLRCNVNPNHNITEFPQHTPITSTNIGNATYEKLILKGKSGQIIFDTNSISENQSAQLRTYKIVENGQLKTVKLLST